MKLVDLEQWIRQELKEAKLGRAADEDGVR